MTISAKVVEDSINEHSKRLVTLQLVYPRFVHAEFMTHRVFSRNASSSRAIPVAKMIEQVRTRPAKPIHWGKNQPGMQAREQLSGFDLITANDLWDDAANAAADLAEKMNSLGLHKQVANRILEPFQHMHVVVTATEWANFFELRDHDDAEPNIRQLAVVMKEAMKASRPVFRAIDSFKKRFEHPAWHLPYVTEQERLKLPLWLLIQLSVARCARVSYLTHDGAEPNIDKDVELYERLVGSRPIHASPTEHQAFPLSEPDQTSKNFVGWRQYREKVEFDAQRKTS